MPFPQNGETKDFYEQMRGLRLIFQVGGPAFLRFTPFFPAHGCVEDSGKQVDRLTNSPKNDSKPSKSKGEVRPFLETFLAYQLGRFLAFPLSHSPP